MADAMDVDAPGQPPTVVAGAPGTRGAAERPIDQKAEAGERSPPARGWRSTAPRR